MGHAKTIARNSLWSLADSLLGMVSSFGCSIAVARAIGPELQGYFSWVTWMVSMAAFLASFGIPAATRTYAAEAMGRGEYALVRSIISITFRIQLYIALAAVVIGLAVVFIAAPSVHRPFALVAVVGILPALLYTIPSAGIAATEDLAPNVRASLVSTVFIGGGTVLALVFHWGLVGLTGAMTASRTVDFVLRQHFYNRIFAKYPKPEGKQKLPPELKARIIKFCKEAVFISILEIVVWERSEVFFLQHFSSMSQVSFFTTPFNWVSQWLLLLPRIVSSAAGASIAVQHGRDPKGTASLAIQSTRVLALIILPAAFGLSALATPIILVLLKEPYRAAIGPFAVLAILTLGKALQLPARQLLISTGRQHMVVKWGIALCFVTVLLDVLLVPHGGAMGAAIAKGIILMTGGISIWWIIAIAYGERLPLAIVGRMTVASALMFAIVRTVAAALPHLAALVVGPLVGIAAIVVLYRVLRCLEPSDRNFLNALGRRLPARARPAFAAMIGFMFPQRAPTTDPSPGAAA